MFPSSSGGLTHFSTFHRPGLLYGMCLHQLKLTLSSIDHVILTTKLIWCRYLAMAIAHVPCFSLYWFIVKGKHTYFPRLFPHSYVRTS